MVSFNTPSDLRRVLKLDAGNEYYTDTELQEFLDKANESLYNEIKRKFEYQKCRVKTDEKGNTLNRFQFVLGPVSAVQEVRREDTVIASGNYTLNADLNLLEFNANVLEVGDVVEIWYLPLVYTEAELYIAAYHILSTTNVAKPSRTSTNIEDIKLLKDDYLHTINSRMMVTGWF